MSYILDALRKSEQQRRLGATPTLHSAVAPPPVTERKRRWARPALAVAFAGIAFALGWLQPWRPTPSTPMLPSVAAPSAGDAPVAAVPTPVEPRMAQESAPHDATASARTRKEIPAGDAPGPAPAAAPAAAPPAVAKADTAPAPAPAASEKRTAAKEPPPASREPAARKPEAKQEEKVISVAELPPALRAELPAMTITVHSYSPTPAERLVGVNNRFLHEGDPLSPDLVLEKITPDGMVFNYKGTRFHRGLR